MIAKFTEKQLESLEAEAELRIYKIFQSKNAQLGLPLLRPEDEKQFRLGNERCSPKIWDFFERAGPSAKQRLFSHAVLTAILSDSEIDRYEQVCNNLEPFMMGSRDGAGPQEKQAFAAFKYYKELSAEAMRYFLAHFERSEYFGFATSAYEQWFSSLRLGLYSAPDRVLTGYGSLNYPDLKPATRGIGNYSEGNFEEYSPRLDALKEYLKIIYELRVKSQLLDILIRNSPKTGTSANVNMGQWEKFVNSTRQGLRNKFGSSKGDQLFKKMFGSDNPTAPASQTDFNSVQNEVLEQMAQAILREQMGGDPLEEPEPKPSDPFRRNYAQEQAEREAREAENQRQRERQQAENDWSDLNPQFKNNPNLVKQWTDKNFNKEQTKEWIDIGFKPTESEYAQFLRDIKNLTPEQVLNQSNLEQIKQEYQQWKNKPPKEKEKDIKEPPKPEQQPKEPKPKSRSSSPSRQAAKDQMEDKPTPPPKHTEFNSSALNEALNSLTGALEEDKKDNPVFDGSLPPINNNMPISQLTKEEMAKLPWLVMGFELKEYPCWGLYSPHTIPFGGGGSGDYVTLLLELKKVRHKENFSDVIHNFFWAKNHDKKGFDRLVKDEVAPNENEKLLVAGKRADDPRAGKYGWTSWLWLKNYKIPIGVPNVKQKSNRFTRWARNQENAYDLDDEGHFIGILRKKGLMKREGTLLARDYDWGSAPKRSILWITNQVDLDIEGNRDWLGDDPHTVNPANGFSHYLIFSDFTIREINDWFLEGNTVTTAAKSLAELIGLMNKEEKTVLVRIGPDALELIDSQDENQKGRSKDENPETREKTTEQISDQDLKEMGLTREEFDLLTTAFTDPAQIANLIKKLASGKDPHKVAQMLNKMFDTIHEKTREAMFNQMVDNNPVFNAEEKEKLKKAYQQAQTKEDKKKVWETLTSHQAQREAHAQKTKEEKDKIFEEQVNKNPRYGPPGVDTQERRDRFKEYEKADETKKENLQEEENTRFTQGENANQWGNYFQDNANHECGAGDETVGTESDNNFSGNFSFTDSLSAINKLKNLGSMKPKGMEEGMKSNKPYWEIVFAHPLTYIFLFIGILIAIMAAVTRKNK